MTSPEKNDYRQRNPGHGGDGHSNNQFSDDDARGQTSQRDGSVASSDGYGRPVRNTKNSQHSGDDVHYHQWREEHMRNLDTDYATWRGEGNERFSDEFSRWRNNRQQNTTPQKPPEGSSEPDPTALP